MTGRALGACLALALLLVGPGLCRAADGPASAGESIYRLGITGSGAAVEAGRGEGSRVRGAAAACVNCHQRSGLGGREGRNTVPPITARYLYGPQPNGDEHDMPFVPGMRGDREPYTDATLARAIREGLDSAGRPLSYLMPRYEFGEADMAAVLGHLKRLDRRRVPGVTDSTLHFATIITPDADAVKRRGMLDVLKQFFADRNVRQMVPAPPMQSSAKTAYARSMFMVHRRWELHVWELTGPASTWQQQLEKRLAAEPVFAVVSGLGGSNWAPVHAFCERSGLPCLFPNVEAPQARGADFYSMYFSQGVLLEAELMARHLLAGEPGAAPKKVVQLYRADDNGEAGATALAAALERQGAKASSQVLPAGSAGPGAVAEALRAAAGADTLVLWLRPGDVAALGSAPPEASTVVYLSGLMAGLERAPLPPAWRARTLLAYPFDLPDRRRVRVDFALGWFRARQIPVVAEQVQADTYLACSLVSETLNHVAGTFVRDYLVERTEAMLEHRIVTGYYPRLALATGQRFASKGGYVVRWPEPAGTRIVADGDWTVP